MEVSVLKSLSWPISSRRVLLLLLLLPMWCWTFRLYPILLLRHRCRRRRSCNNNNNKRLKPLVTAETRKLTTYVRLLFSLFHLSKYKNKIKNRLEENLKSLNQFIRLTGINCFFLYCYLWFFVSWTQGGSERTGGSRCGEDWEPAGSIQYSESPLWKTGLRRQRHQERRRRRRRRNQE